MPTAARLLVFGDLEPFLRCQTKHVTVRTRTFLSYDGSAIQPRHLINGIRRGDEYAPDIENGYHDLRLAFFWPQIVGEYTSRTLRFEEDKPLAIGSIIDSISRATGDECHYGVWKSCPLTCLVWAVVPVEGVKCCPIPALPSWSWMSVTGEVQFDMNVNLCRTEASFDWDAGPLLTRLRLSCRVLSEDEVFMTTPEGGSSALLLDHDVDLCIGKTMLPHEVRSRPLISGSIYFLILGRLTTQDW